MISSEHPAAAPTEVATTTGPTTLWGHLVEVDEAGSPKALMVLARGTRFWAQITEEIVAVIRGEGLIGQDIGLRGEATWLLDDWSLVSFAAHGLDDYRQGNNLVETFRKLREASNGRWETVDPVAFVRDLRDGDDCWPHPAGFR